ncbi:MAG: hypothetical protein M1142_06435 [Patescibacteria group bacterium]|nr:hypothetical protein [Patescibacteria group bacterium]
MAKIIEISLKTILDSRQEDTLEVEMFSGEYQVRASVPSGKSKGSNEAFVIKPKLALEKFAHIKPYLLNHEFSTLEDFDNLLLSLDETLNKRQLGGNLILVLSIAFTKLLAMVQKREIFEVISEIAGTKPQKFPLCFFNLIEGGVHAKNSLPFQEYLLIPQTDSPKESLDRVLSFIQVLGEREHDEFGRLSQGDEGGYTVPSKDPKAGLDLLNEVKNETGQTEDRIGLDVAASAFYQNGVYKLGNQSFNRSELLNFYQDLENQFTLFSIEDPFDEKDYKGFAKIKAQLGEKVWIIGDDLTTTNSIQIKRTQEKDCINAVIIKPNQIGSVSETIRAATLAQSYGWKIVVSHRSGETMDTFIADLAYGLGADGFKSGCPLQKERLVKYQRLIEIADTLSK